MKLKNCEFEKVNARLIWQRVQSGKNYFNKYLQHLRNFDLTSF